MSIFKWGCLILSLLIIYYIGYNIFVLLSPPSLPDVDDNIWWGNEARSEEDISIREFKINVPDELINDLKWRLANSRFTAPYINGSANKYGINLMLLKDILQFWLYRYNWLERQEYLNKFPQYVTSIQGLDIHFIHIKPTNTDKKMVRPFLILHGWPGSVREFYDVIEILQNESSAFAFELVVPSLPGFGFSQAPNKSGLSLAQAAIIMKKLMSRLGHQKFYVQGGDLGSITLQIMCVLYPESILGFHTNFPIVYTPKGYLKPLLGLFCPYCVVKREHYDRVYPLSKAGMFIYKESGYLHLQSTKPDSIGAAMDDSPTGLAAYFLEKFIIGSNFSWVNDFDLNYLQRKFPYTYLLDNLMYYWITGSATTAFRIYYETFGEGIWSESFVILRSPVKVPTIIFRSKYDLYMPDGVLSEIYPMLLSLTDHNVGHFPAFENPQILSEDILRSIEIFEDYRYRLEYYKIHHYFPYT